MASTCEVCEASIQTERPTTKYCGNACRQRAKRDRARAAREAAKPAAPVSPVSSPLADSVLRELIAVGAEKTYAGQLALELARRLSEPEANAAAGLSRELRTVMASALDGATPPPPVGDEPDLVDDLKAIRDRKAAGARAGGSA